MSVFNNIKIELVILFLISISIFISPSLDYKIYYFFNVINKDVENVFLKDFFVQITKLGDSSWYFAISVIGFVFFYLNNKFKVFALNKSEKLINFFFTTFFYILAVGIVTQVLKHIVGRPRPNHSSFDNTFEFNFFNLNSNYHSFPSGHSSTIFMVCFILISILPKFKYFFVCLAAVVALSRVSVSAHFFTDILAGAILALVIFKVLNNLVEKKYSKYKFSTITFKEDSKLFHYILFLFISCLFLTSGPSLDLYISKFFYYGKSQFALQSVDIISIFFRDILLPFILVYILVLPIIGKVLKINNFFFGYNFSTKEIFLLWCSQIISVLIFVNLILKNFWGRARPNDVLQLGGSEGFTPWYEFSRACSSNCSFVSGDASVGFSIIILYLITKNILFLYFSIASGFLLGLIRIMAGGHFVSDIFFGGIFIVILNLFIFKMYKKYYVR